MPTGSTSEAGLQRRIVAAIRAQYPSAFLFHPVGGPYQIAGIPDLLICLDGSFVGIEIKFQRPGESEQHARARATAQQLKIIAKIVEAGGYGGVVLSVGEALQLCEFASEQAWARWRDR